MISDPSISGNSKEAVEKRMELMQQYRKHWMKKYMEATEWAESLKDMEKLFRED